MSCIAVLNAGSSSIKLAAYSVAADAANCCSRGVSRASAPRRNRSSSRLTERCWRNRKPGRSITTRRRTCWSPWRRRRSAACRLGGGRPSRRARRAEICRADPRHRRAAGRTGKLRAARAAAPAAQSRADPRDPQRGSRRCRRSSASIRPSIARMPGRSQTFALPREILGRGRPPLRLSRHIL